MAPPPVLPARSTVPAARRPIGEVARELGLDPDALVPAGRDVLRVPVPVVRSRFARGHRGRVVLVTAITPTSHGEGKTVVTISLAMALHRAGRRAIACLRQPSLGPVFGAKGGASGGGRAAVEPRPEIDLGFTGDLDAIANAQNLLASLVDHHIYQGNRLGIDPSPPVLPRAFVLEDRSLRDVSTGLSVRAEGFPRPGQFVIAPASEMAAIHGLSGEYAELKARIDRMIVARDRSGAPLRAAALGATGSVAAVLGPALAPNLVTTTEGTPALVHGVPYANVAHGTCSRIALDLARATAELCIVEAGFASELGAEKFVDLVGPQASLDADAAVLVVTLRALAAHGGQAPAAAGPAPPSAVEAGLPNLEAHLENLRKLGLDPVVALNRFPTDGAASIDGVRRFCRDRNATFVEVDGYGSGGDGAVELAARVAESAERGQRSHPLYPPDAPLEEMLRKVAVDLYGGDGIALADAARADLARIRADGEPEGPPCIAKTPLSLSPDPTRLGRPRGFTVPIRRLFRWAGAGFTVAYAGPAVAMPGLPAHPATESIRLEDDGRVTGLI